MALHIYTMSYLLILVTLERNIVVYNVYFLLNEFTLLTDLNMNMVHKYILVTNDRAHVIIIYIQKR